MMNRGQRYMMVGALALGALMAAGGGFPRAKRVHVKPAKPTSNRKAQLLEKALRRQARGG